MHNVCGTCGTASGTVCGLRMFICVPVLSFSFVQVGAETFAHLLRFCVSVRFVGRSRTALYAVHDEVVGWFTERQSLWWC